ncbi:MAG: hypothetical protein ACC682_15655 [Gemmatimonadota bacterium]
MSIQDLGSLGEFVGAIAVVLSLIYVSLQVKQNTRALRGAAVAAVSDRSADAMAMVAQDPDLADIIAKAVVAEPDLTAAERIRFDMLMGCYFTHWQGLYLQARFDTIDEELFSAWEHVIAFYASRPHVMDWLESPLATLTPDFKRYVKGLAGESRSLNRLPADAG